LKIGLEVPNTFGKLQHNIGVQGGGVTVQ